MTNAGPDIPLEERPWRQNKALDEQAFIHEVREWDVNEVVFSKAMWPMYQVISQMLMLQPPPLKKSVTRLPKQPILRSDFAIFDEYEYPQENVPSFNTPILCFHAKNDRKITEPMVKR